MVIFCKVVLVFLLLSVFSSSLARPFDTDSFKYHSYKAYSAVGFYTGANCIAVEVDHIVSFRDAHDSGASDWSDFKKALFANDRKNHVPSCSKIDELKADLPPAEFMLKARETLGPEFKIIEVCEYLTRYHTVKTKYSLSFQNNSEETFAACGLAI